MNTGKTTMIALLLALSSTSFSATAGEGFYAGASIGSATLDGDFDGLDIDSDVTAYRLVGGWWVNRYLALEAGYHNFGDFQQNFIREGVSSKARLSADGYTLGAQASYPLTSRIGVFGRAGAFFWDGEAEINNVSQASPGETNPYLSLGLSYSLTENLSVNGDWTGYKLESSNSDVFSLGFQFRFGR